MSNLDQKYFEAVAQELEAKNLKAGLWARAVAEAGSDDGRARAKYIGMRVKELAKEDSQRTTTFFSLGRLAYPFAQLGAYIVAALIVAVLFSNYEHPNRLTAYIAYGFFLLIAAMRLRDIGNGGWIACYLLIPIVNIVIAGELYAKPKGYAKTGFRDKTMRVVLWIYYLIVIPSLGLYLYLDRA